MFFDNRNVFKELSLNSCALSLCNIFGVEGKDSIADFRKGRKSFLWAMGVAQIYLLKTSIKTNIYRGLDPGNSPMSIWKCSRGALGIKERIILLPGTALRN